MAAPSGRFWMPIAQRQRRSPSHALSLCRQCEGEAHRHALRYNVEGNGCHQQRALAAGQVHVLCPPQMGQERRPARRESPRPAAAPPPRGASRERRSPPTARWRAAAGSRRWPPSSHPAAKPSMVRWNWGRGSSTKKNTTAAPKVVIRKVKPVPKAAQLNACSIRINAFSSIQAEFCLYASIGDPPRMCADGGACLFPGTVVQSNCKRKYGSYNSADGIVSGAEVSMRSPKILL